MSKLISESTPQVTQELTKELIGKIRDEMDIYNYIVSLDEAGEP